MIKYAILQDELTGLCSVALGDDIETYKEMGMTQMNVAQSDIDWQWYLAEKCPMKTPEQKKQEEQERLARTYMTKWDFVKYVLNPHNFTYAMLKEVLAKDVALEEAWACCSYVYRGDDTLCTNLPKLLPTVTTAFLDEAFRNHGTYGG